jgi:hypothetical protein
MRWSDIPFRPPRTTLRWFAGYWLVLFAALAGVQAFAWDRPYPAAVLLGLGLVVGAAGLASPPAVRPLFVALMVLTFPVGWVFSQVVLVVLFCVLFVPVGLLFKLVGRDALARRWLPGGQSYWASKPAAGDIRQYFRQS